MEKRNYKLYVHISPNNKRYYGITKQLVKKRWASGYGYNNQHFYNAINKYGWHNFEHIVLFDNLTKEEAELLEQMYIALYNTTNPKYGYNITHGGDGWNGIHHTEETKTKISESHKKIWTDPEYRAKHSGVNNPNYGKHLSEEHKRKISKANQGQNNAFYGKHHTEESKQKQSEAKKGVKNPMYGKHFTEESKKKLSKSLKGKFVGEKSPWYGKKHTEESKKKMRDNNAMKRPEVVAKFMGSNSPVAKKIICIETGEIFECIKDAETKYNSKTKNATNISACCRGRQGTAYGYHWAYLDDNNKPIIIKIDKVNKRTRPILMFTLDGKFIRKFNSVADANEYINKDRNNVNIYMCASGKHDTAWGYKWEYEVQEAI